MRYLVTRESVQNRIAEMKQLGMSGHVELRPDTPGHDATRQDVTGHDETMTREIREKLKVAEEECDALREGHELQRRAQRGPPVVFIDRAHELRCFQLKTVPANLPEFAGTVTVHGEALCAMSYLLSS